MTEFRKTKIKILLRRRIVLTFIIIFTLMLLSGFSN